MILISIDTHFFFNVPDTISLKVFFYTIRIPWLTLALHNTSSYLHVLSQNNTQYLIRFSFLFLYFKLEFSSHVPFILLDNSYQFKGCEGSVPAGGEKARYHPTVPGRVRFSFRPGPPPLPFRSLVLPRYRCRLNI